MAQTTAFVETVGVDSALGIQLGNVFPVTFVSGRFIPGSSGFRLEFAIDLGAITLTDGLLDGARIAITDIFLDDTGELSTFTTAFPFSFGGQSFFFLAGTPPGLERDQFAIRRMVDATSFADVATGRFVFPAKVTDLPEPSALGLLGLAGLAAHIAARKRAS